MAALLFPPLPVAGVEADLLEPLGPLDFEMIPRLKGNVSALLIPIHIGTEGPPDRLVVESVTLAGKVQLGCREAFHPELGGSGDLRELIIRIAPELIPETGTYGIRLRAVHSISPVRFQTLSLTLTRPAAVLHTLPILRLELVHGVWMQLTRLSPSSLLMTETSGKAELHELIALPLGELKGPNDQPVEASLRLVSTQNSLSLAPLEQKQVPLRIEGDLPLGTTTGTLSFISPQLGAPHTIAVQIVSRIWKGWLLITLLVSLALGWLVRVWLEKRRQVLEAGIAVRRQSEDLLNLATRQADPDLQAKFRNASTNLEREVVTQGRDPEALKTSVARAAEAAEQWLREAENRRGELRTQIAELRRRLGTQEGQAAELGALTERSLSELDRLERELASGLVGIVATEVANFEQRLPVRFLEASTRWKADLETSFRIVKFAPETLLGSAVEALQKELAELDKEEKDLPQLLAWGRRTAFLVRQRILRGGLAEIGNEAERVVQILPRENGASQRVQAAIDALRSQPHTDSEVGDLRAALRAIRELQDSMAEAVRAQASQPTPQSIEEALDKSEFARAAEMVIKGRERSRKPVLGGSESAQSPVLGGIRRFGLASPVQPTPGEPRIFSLSIDIPSSPVAGRSVPLRLRVHGEPPSRYTVRWSAGGEAEGESDSVGLLWRFRPHHPGPVLVTAELRDLDGGGVVSAEALFEVRSFRPSLPALEQSLGRTEHLQSAVVGLMVAGTGYLLFQRDFIGTFQDFFLAALWGFTVDAGVSKLREMATPLLGRPVPLPKNEG
jgi:hypothetical protein